MTKQINTTISEEFYALAQDLNLSWSEALRIGLSFLFMERGVFKFKNPLNKERIKILAENQGFQIVKENEIN